MAFVIGAQPYNVALNLDSTQNLMGIGNSLMDLGKKEDGPGGSMVLGSRRFWASTSDNSKEVSPVRGGRGAIPLSNSQIVAFGQDWITAGKMGVSFAGLGIWQLNISGASLYGVSLITQIQAPSDARVPGSGEKSMTPDNAYAFKSMGKYWSVDAIIDHGGGTGERRYIGLFDVETKKYTDLQNCPKLIEHINVSGKAMFRF